jgi:hypothetical protein
MKRDYIDYKIENQLYEMPTFLYHLGPEVSKRLPRIWLQIEKYAKPLRVSILRTAMYELRIQSECH